MLDCATIHTSPVTRAMFANHGSLYAIYVQKNSTGYNQPLDFAYFRAFKASIRRGIAESWAQDVFDSHLKSKYLSGQQAAYEAKLAGFCGEGHEGHQHSREGWNGSKPPS
eukprot:737472-Amphidinium_carterae.3